MEDPEVTQLRAGVRALMEMALRKSLADADHARIPGLAAELEQACLTTAQSTGPDYRSRYATIYNGLIKATAFGVIIAVISCYKGFNASGGARGVGQATTEAVVNSSILVFVGDYVLTVLMF